MSQIITAPPPPPPAPPPCLSKSKTVEFGGAILDRPYRSAEVQSQKAYCMFEKIHGLSTAQSMSFISGYLPVVPVIQNGPLCGMVALAMASDLIGEKRILTEDILLEARARGFSKQGEMFSVQSMETLTSFFLSCETMLISISAQDSLKEKIVSNLMRKNLVIMPYDEDKDHGPCLKKGHKAHWTVLTGFFLAVQPSCVPSLLSKECKANPEVPSILQWNIHSSHKVPEETVVNFLTSPDILIYVFGHQGKSKYAGIWRLDDLLESNLNLEEVGPERTTEDYVIPAGGISESLKGQLIVIMSKNGT